MNRVRLLWNRSKTAIEIVLSLAVAFALPLAAQQDRATIEGLVTDSSGAVVADAQVSVVHVETNDEVLLKTNETGRYFAPNLPIGTYRVKVSKDGFNSAVRDHVQLQAQASVRLDFALAVGNVTQTVQVESASPLVDASTATITATLSNRQWRISRSLTSAPSGTLASGCSSCLA
jgi:Carboxypeptidase regulatory-like domain